VDEAVHKFAPTFNTNTKTQGMCEFGEYKFLLFWWPIGDRFDLVNGHWAASGGLRTPIAGLRPAPPSVPGPTAVPAAGTRVGDMHWDGRGMCIGSTSGSNSAQGVLTACSRSGSMGGWQ